MTLIDLVERAQAIIERNEQAGWGDRNHLPVYLRLSRSGRKKDRWYRIRLASSAKMTVGEKTFMELEAAEDDEATINR